MLILKKKKKGLISTVWASSLRNVKIMSRLSCSKQHSVIVFAFNKEMIKRRPTINGPENRKGVRKINEAKSYSFFGKKKNQCIWKISSKIGKGKKKMWKDTNYQFQQWGANTTDPAALKRLRCEPYKKLSANKFEHLDETNQFLKSYKLSNSPR